MSKMAAKRFYKTSHVERTDKGFIVKLDSYTLRTPGKKPLILPSEFLAQSVSAEWDAQGDMIKPETMPATRLLNVACERTPDNRDGLVAEVRKYAATDLLCYRETNLLILTERQTEHWDPVLDWVRDAHSVDLAVTQGVIAVTQSDASLDKAADYAALLDDIALTLLTHFTSVFGSAVLAMALLDGFLTADKALELSRLDELYQIELWGQDEEAEVRSKAIHTETLALAALLKGKI